MHIARLSDMLYFADLPIADEYSDLPPTMIWHMRVE